MKKNKSVEKVPDQSFLTPKNLEINKDLLEHIDPSETNEIDYPYYKLKKYLKYKIK